MDNKILHHTRLWFGSSLSEDVSITTSEEEEEGKPIAKISNPILYSNLHGNNGEMSVCHIPVHAIAAVFLVPSKSQEQGPQQHPDTMDMLCDKNSSVNITSPRWKDRDGDYKYIVHLLNGEKLTVYSSRLLL